MANFALKSSSNSPLEVNEVMRFIRNRWGVLYQLKILIKGKSLYLQMMWGFLEQQSFPFNESEYVEHLAEVLEIVNRLGQAQKVRNWLLKVKGKPRIGLALSLPLKGDERLEEFVL